MDSLYQLFHREAFTENEALRNKSEKIADTLCCLCDAIDKGTFLQGAPDGIQISDDGTVSSDRNAPGGLYYAAPEVVLDDRSPDQSAGLFSLGLLAYFIIHGRSYYEVKGLYLVDLPERMREGTCLIPANGVNPNTKEVPGLYALAIEKFTSWNPKARVDGVKILLEAIRQYNSYAQLVYQLEGKTVGGDRIEIAPSGHEVSQEIRIAGYPNQVFWPCQALSINFRPGTHEYVVAVKCSSPKDPGAPRKQERYLYASVENMVKMQLFSLDRGCQTVRCAASDRSSGKNIYFRVGTIDSATNKLIHMEKIPCYCVRVPPADSVIQVSYHPGSGCNLKIRDEVFHFDV